MNELVYICPRCGERCVVDEASDEYLVKCTKCGADLDLTELPAQPLPPRHDSSPSFRTVAYVGQPATKTDDNSTEAEKRKNDSKEVFFQNEELTKANQTFKFACPYCGQHLEAESDWVGMESECPECGKMLTVPPPQSDTASSVSSHTTLKTVSAQDSTMGSINNGDGEVQPSMPRIAVVQHGIVRHSSPIGHNIGVKDFFARHRKMVFTFCAVTVLLGVAMSIYLIKYNEACDDELLVLQEEMLRRAYVHSYYDYLPSEYKAKDLPGTWIERCWLRMCYGGPGFADMFKLDFEQALDAARAMWQEVYDKADPEKRHFMREEALARYKQHKAEELANAQMENPLGATAVEEADAAQNKSMEANDEMPLTHDQFTRRAALKRNFQHNYSHVRFNEKNGKWEPVDGYGLPSKLQLENAAVEVEWEEYQRRLNKDESPLTHDQFTRREAVNVKRNFQYNFSHVRFNEANGKWESVDGYGLPSELQKANAAVEVAWEDYQRKLKARP